MPPACLALAVAGAADSTLAPEVALYVCGAQQQLPAGLLEDVRVEVQAVLQVRERRAAGGGVGLAEPGWVGWEGVGGGWGGRVGCRVHDRWEG